VNVENEEETMVNKKFWLGMLVMALVFGMTVGGCGEGDEPTDGDGDAKTIIITGITGKNGNVELELYSYDGEEFHTAVEGYTKISNNSASFSLFEGYTRFTGNGSYFLGLYFEEDDSAFVYTNGQTLTALGIIETQDEAEFFLKLPKYTISSATSTIAFNKFAKMPEWW
jgi:hypothetical protein